MHRTWIRICFGLAIFWLPNVAAAEIDCGPLKPNPPRDISSEASGKIDAKNIGESEISSMIVQISAFADLLDSTNFDLPTYRLEQFCARRYVRSEYPGCLKGKNDDPLYMLQSMADSGLFLGASTSTASIGAALYASLFSVAVEFRDECRNIPAKATVVLYVRVEGFSIAPSGQCPEHLTLIPSGTSGIAMLPSDLTLDVIAPNGRISHQIGQTSEPLNWTQSGTTFKFTSSKNSM
jgi:hypothetical protein